MATTPDPNADEREPLLAEALWGLGLIGVVLVTTLLISMAFRP